MKVNITISLREDVLDPQGRAICNALLSLGFSNILKVRQNKVITVELDETDPDEAKKQAVEMCRSLLANSVTEEYSIQVDM